MPAMNTLARNLRFLLLEKKVKPANWAATLASVLRSKSEEKARALLAGEQVNLTDGEKEYLGTYGADLERFKNQEIWKKAEENKILEWNLTYLFDGLLHGEKKKFAEQVGVNATTISRWKKGTQQPTKKKTAAILEYFNLPESTNLKAEPLFFSTMPIGEAETKKWLHEQIDKLSSSDLRELFPALERLLRERK